MVGKTERQMTMDCRKKSPGWPDCFSASHGVHQKSGNVENRDIG